MIASTLILALYLQWQRRSYVKSNYWFDCRLTGLIFRSSPQSRPNRAGLRCPYVRPSTKSLFDFNDIWRVGRGRWTMQDGMHYDPIQGQGHEPFRVGNLAILKSYLLCHLQWELATDHSLIFNLWHNTYIWSGRIFDICPSFVSRDFALGRHVSCEELTVSFALG